MSDSPLSSIVATEEQMLPGGWEMIVGLEVHVELATRTKLFSGSPNRFGDEPNINIDPVTAWSSRCFACAEQASGRTCHAYWFGT